MLVVCGERLRAYLEGAAGSGRSERPAFPRRGGFDAAEAFFVDAMEAAFDELGLTKFTLAGHSMVCVCPRLVLRVARALWAVSAASCVSDNTSTVCVRWLCSCARVPGRLVLGAYIPCVSVPYVTVLQRVARRTDLLRFTVPRARVTRRVA